MTQNNLNQSKSTPLEQRARLMAFEIAKVGQETPSNEWHEMNKPLREKLDVRAYEILKWLDTEVEAAYKRGYIDGGIGELTKVQDQMFKGNELFRYSRKRVNELTKKEKTK